MSGRLTTHVLDTARGRPAGGMAVELYHLPAAGGLSYVCSAVTNEDGRLKEPLLAAGELFAGTFELMFQVGAYYRLVQPEWTEPMLWEAVPIRFTIQRTNEHYHIPLLIAPGGYSTYRGS